MANTVERGLTLSSRLSLIEPSPTMAVMAEATRLKQSGEDVVDFAAGQPDFDTPAAIKQAGIAAIEQDFTRYTANPGTSELRAAVAERYRQDYGFAFEASNVIITSGGKHALFNLMLALLDTDDEVVIPTPYWATFGEQTRLAGGKAVLVATSEADGFSPSVSLIEAALTEKTRIVLLNVPANPTGVVPSAEVLRDIAEFSRDKEYFLLWDDTYAKLMFSPLPTDVLSGMQQALGDRFVVAGTASKAYAMTGWRLGWALASEAIIKACAMLQSQMTSNASSITQRAGLQAMTGDQSEVRRMVTEYEARARILFDGLTGIDGVSAVFPGGGFYVFPNISAYLRPGETSTEFAKDLLNTQRVAVVPGVAFGHDGYLRMSFATTRERIEEGVRRIVEFLSDRRR